MEWGRDLILSAARTCFLWTSLNFLHEMYLMASVTKIFAIGILKYFERILVDAPEYSAASANQVFSRHQYPSL
jgi:hypothetical protein